MSVGSLGRNVFRAALSAFSSDPGDSKAEAVLQDTLMKPDRQGFFSKKRFFSLADGRLDYWASREDSQRFPARGSYDLRDLDSVHAITEPCAAWIARYKMENGF